MKMKKKMKGEETGRRCCISEQPGAIHDGCYFLKNKKDFIQNAML